MAYELSRVEARFCVLLAHSFVHPFVRACVRAFVYTRSRTHASTRMLLAEYNSGNTTELGQSCFEARLRSSSFHLQLPPRYANIRTHVKRSCENCRFYLFFSITFFFLKVIIFKCVCVCVHGNCFTLIFNIDRLKQLLQGNDDDNDTMMRWSGYSAYLLLGLFVYLATVQTVTACSCRKNHPQTHFCTAEFVAVVRIKKIIDVNEFEMAYKVKINRVFKSSPDADVALKQNLLWTSSSDSLCGVTYLAVGETYVVSGGTINGKAKISICNLLIPWSKVTSRQRKGFRLLYHHGCACEISYTQWWHKGAVLESTGGKRCLWESSPGPESCQEKYGICMKAPGGCSWIPSVPYNNCIKEHQRKVLQERLREP